MVKMSTTIKPTPEIYRKAARIIADGWVTDSWVKMIPGKTGIPCYCMEGAIMKAAGLKPTRDILLRRKDLLRIKAITNTFVCHQERTAR